MLKAKTFAQLQILKWLESQPISLKDFFLEAVDDNHIRIMDRTSTTKMLCCEDGYVYIEEQ